MYAATDMMKLLAIRKTVLPKEPLLKIFPQIGDALSATK